MTLEETRGPEATAPSRRRAGLHVLVLFGFAVAQPLYDLLGGNPAFFVYRRFDAGDFFFLVGLLSVLLPLTWVLLIQALPGPARRLAFAASIAVLGAAILLPWLHRQEALPAWPALALALIAGLGLAIGWLRTARVPQALSLLAPSIVVFAGLFLLRPGVRQQWLGGDLAWSGEMAAAATPPIVLVVFDALPTSSLMDDRHAIDAVRYPNFARLASEGTWYRRASTVSPMTIEAVPAILAGQCPGAAAAPTYSSYPRNLFTLLSGQYDLRVAERVTQLCHPELCGEEPANRGRRLLAALRDAGFIFLHRLLPGQWTATLPAVDNAWGDFGVGGSTASSTQSAVDKLDQFRELVARVSAGERPALYFAHLVLPHAPFFYLPSGARYRMRDREPAGSWKVLGADPWVANHSYQRHLLQLGFADSLLGELLERLDEVGIYDDALVIVTADHGSSFRPGESRRRSSGGNAIDILAVPFFVKLPGQRLGQISDRRVQTVDIVALVADTLGLAPVSWSDGHWAEASETAGERVSCSAIEGGPGPDLPLADLYTAAERKKALFGTGRNAGVFPATGPRPEVVGLPAATGVCEEREAVAVKLTEPELYDDVDPSRFVPAEIVGVAHGPAARSIELAVAVNGAVVATTRPYELGTEDTATWAAIVPESALRAGRNDIEVLAIDESGSECLLRPVRALTGSPSFLDSRLGVWRVPEVAESGFHATLRSEVKMMRWTNGRGRLRVPLRRAEDNRPRALRVEVGAVGDTGANLTIRLNRRVLGEFRIERAPWSWTFELEGSTLPDRLDIRLQSDTFMMDGRKHGVGVDGVWLLSQATDGAGSTNERR